MNQPDEEGVEYTTVSDSYHDREKARLMAQLKSGNHLRVYHFGMSPANIFPPNKPESVSQVRHEVAQQLIDSGEVDLLKKGWNFDVYVLKPTP